MLDLRYILYLFVLYQGSNLSTDDILVSAEIYYMCVCTYVKALAQV